MKRFFLMSLLFLVGFSCFAQKDTTIYNTHYNNVEYYDTGQLKELGHLKNGKKTGYWISFYKKRRNKEIANYKNGELNGKYYKFSEDGTIKEGGKYKKGKKHGFWTYIEEGKITAGKYKNDKKKGDWYSGSVNNYNWKKRKSKATTITIKANKRVSKFEKRKHTN